MTAKLRTAVVGAGYLGSYHAQKYNQLPQSSFTAIAETHPERRKELQTLYPEISIVDDYRKLLGKVDAVSIATPTPKHFEVASFFITHNVPVLIEKPLTVSLAEADKLIALTRKNNTFVQVGHIERFNNVIKELRQYIRAPRFIESHRLAPFQLRNTDVNVVLDLMIHDIDIVCSFACSPIKEISAIGSSVLTPHIDLVHAHIKFQNGCVANITASRVSEKSERKCTIFESDACITADLLNKKLRIHKKSTEELFPGIPKIQRTTQTLEPGDALQDQIECFLNSILDNTAPAISIEDGRNALEIAEQVVAAVQQHNNLYYA